MLIIVCSMAQWQIRHCLQVQGEVNRPPAGRQVCAHTEEGGQEECGAGSGDNEFIAASSHYTIVCCVRISENDVRRPGTVRIVKHTYVCYMCCLCICVCVSVCLLVLQNFVCSFLVLFVTFLLLLLHCCGTHTHNNISQSVAMCIKYDLHVRTLS